MNVILNKQAEFSAEIEVADRLDGPVGREIYRISSDVEELAAIFADRSSIDTHMIHMIRDGLNRLELHGQLMATQADLEERARAIGRLAEALDNDKAPGAVDRTQSSLNYQCSEVRDIADNAASA